MSTVIQYRPEDIFIQRYRDGGSREYILKPTGETIVHARFTPTRGFVVTCELLGRAVKTPSGIRGSGCDAAVEQFLFEAIGLKYRHAPDGVVNIW